MRAPAQPPRPRARPLGRGRAGVSARPRSVGAILDSVTVPELGARCCWPLLAEGVSGGRRGGAGAKDADRAGQRRDALHPHTGAAGAAKVEPRRRPPRDQRLGCGRSAGGRDGGSAETGPREASCESRGSRRRRPRSPGCCMGEAAPGSRYGGGSGPRPGVGRGGRRRPGSRAGRDGNNAPPRRARASVPVNKAWRARARSLARGGAGAEEDGLLRARPGRRGCGRQESPGTWAVTVCGSRAREARGGKLGELRGSRSGRALQTSTRKPPGQGIAKPRAR